MDRALESTFTIPFTTRSFNTGEAASLIGTPVLSVLEGGNAVPITAGVSVSVDRASVIGLNEATIVATAANGYESGKTYGLYVSTGTIDGVDAVGQIISMFSIDLTAKQVWDRVLIGSTHNINNSAGKRLRQIDAAFEVHSGTAQAGTSTTITLDAGASSIDNIYNGDRCIIVEGTGAQEHGIISDYDGTTKVATLSKAWVVTPDNTSEFVLVPADADVETWNSFSVTSNGDWGLMQTTLDDLKLGIIFGAAVTGTLSTTQMTTNITGFLDDELINATVVFTGGTADGQRASITAYAAASGLVTFSGGIANAPVNGDTFKIV